MKKWKRILLLLLVCLGLSQTAAFSGSGPAVAKAAAKEGLKKEKGKYYFYIEGKKVRNQWETVSDGAKKYRYYFDETGAAVAGKKSGGILVPKICRIKGKSYGFDNQGRMVKGLYVINGEFYLFDLKNGAYKPTVTAKLRAAAKEGQKANTLIGLLKKQAGDPDSRDDFPDSCYGDGKDSVLYYPGFMVQLFTDRKGSSVVVCVNATVRTDQQETEGTVSGEEDTAEESGTENAGAEDTKTEDTKTEDAEAQTDTEKPKAGVKKKGLVQLDGGYYFYKKDGKKYRKLKNAWKKIDGYIYYFTKSGKAQTYSAWINGKLRVFDQKGRLQSGKGNRIVKVGIRRYYVDASGHALTGWRIIGGRLYYANNRSGVLYQDRVYDGVKFSDTCAAENTVAARLKMKTMSIVASITNGGMSSAQKLQACWNYVVSSRFSYGSRYPNLGQGGWQRETALHMLTNHWGNCYSFACAFAALAKEIGYSPYVICGRVSGTRDGAADGLTRHAWVQINGAYYDPEAQFAGWARGIYGVGTYYVANQVQMRVPF